MASDFETPLTPPSAQQVAPISSDPPVPQRSDFLAAPPTNQLGPGAYPSSTYPSNFYGAGAPYIGTPPTSGLAIASLVTGILGFSIIALGLGFAALNRISRTGESGRGLAIAGIVLGGVATAFWMMMVIPFFALAF